MVVAGIGDQLDGHAGLQPLLIQDLGELHRHALVPGRVMQLDWAGQVIQEVVGRDRLPELRVVRRGAIAAGQAVAPMAARAVGIGRGRRPVAAPLARQQVLGRAHHPAPDHAGLDVGVGHHGAQGDPAAHAVAPHADALRVGVGIALERASRIEHVDHVVGGAIGAAGRTLRAVMTAVVGAEDDVAVARGPST